MARWLEDVSTAISYLRKKTGVTQMCLVGLRLGGTLSAMTNAQREGVDSMVLWDPVVNGRNYLEDLFSLQREMLRFRPRPKRGKRSEDCMEILGFPLSRFLRNEIEKINLLQLAVRPARNVLIIRSEEPEGDTSLRDHLSVTDVQVEYQCAKAPHLWLPAADGSLSVPAQLLESIVAWANRIYS
jgi:hypothetical protein